MCKTGRQNIAAVPTSERRRCRRARPLGIVRQLRRGRSAGWRVALGVVR